MATFFLQQACFTSIAMVAVGSWCETFPNSTCMPTVPGLACAVRSDREQLLAPRHTAHVHPHGSAARLQAAGWASPTLEVTRLLCLVQNPFKAARIEAHEHGHLFQFRGLRFIGEPGRYPVQFQLQQVWARMRAPRLWTAASCCGAVFVMVSRNKRRSLRFEAMPSLTFKRTA